MIYGPNTAAVQAIIDRIPTLTEDECKRLAAGWDAIWDPARAGAWAATRDAIWDAAIDAAWDAAWDAARDATRDAARDASTAAARVAIWDAAIDAARDAARDSAWDAILATVTYDLATIDGSYTVAQRDLLLAPWVSVCGMPEAFIATAALDGEA